MQAFADLTGASLQVHTDSMEEPIEEFQPIETHDAECRVVSCIDGIYQLMTTQPTPTKIRAPSGRSRTLNISVHSNPDVQILWGLKDCLSTIENGVQTAFIDCSVKRHHTTLEDVKKWVEDNDGRLPKSRSKDPIEKRYGGWINAQQSKPEMFEKLRTIPGMTDKLLELEEKREGNVGFL